MWNFMTSLSSRDHKMGIWTEHAAPFSTLIGASVATFSDKQFPNFKNNTNSGMPLRQTVNVSVKVTENSSPQSTKPMTNQVINNNNSCNGGRKKRKRRRKKKKKSKTNQNQTKNNIESQNKLELQINNRKSNGRQRHLSVAESEDNFVVFFDENYETETTEEFGSADSIILNKKVRFAADDKLCEVHQMVTWSFAYQAARRGHWEEYARDRDRFKRRVFNSEKVIGHVLTAEHRSRIFEERFA